MLFRRFLGRRALVTLVGVPVVSLGGLGIYVEYRKSTQPSISISYPVFDEYGSMRLDGKLLMKPGSLSVAGRIVELFLLFFPLAVLYVVMRIRRGWYLRWLELLLRAVERAGPAFVKAGQWSCTRNDIFSPEFRSVFRRLYSEVDTHPYTTTLQVLREEFQKDPSELFSEIEPTPVGSGSIGQVHMARLRQTGEKVVVKVMHPKIVETILKDFRIIMETARLLDKYFPSLEMYELPSLARAWRDHLAAQLDFRVEAKHLSIFRENFRHESFVDFPKPLFSTQRVLVESFCKGEPASPEFLSAQEEYVRDILARKGLNTWCKMLLHDNFVHGDMHPGNILIDTSDPHDPRISLIDVGLCQRISPAEADLAHDLMESFVRWKSDLCCSSLLRMGTTQKFVERKKFEQEVDWLFEHWRPKKSSDFAVTNILQSLFECIRENHVQMDPPFVALLFSVLVLESFIMNLNPEFNMVRHAAPWLLGEGHISYGLAKNILLTRLDVLKQDLGVLRGRLRDGVHGRMLQNNGGRLGRSEW
ncbi:ubiquinone biosynthesis protein [Trypanosoma conorhini]|uniref:Ubiquinone biosynthesis protein n=1 Tax=Trypanosoma conorhini TaxID=83891 RepID=A0A3R7PR90_9TRYP|nr:ubiquinone biosynthesis protein [Trypanosoma conorhini]RNF23970.1 ubiquinone biosynthesis protein [Trypanosoma conorhini]